MTNLEKVFDEDYFDDPDITLKRLQKFVGEVLARMIADSIGGKLTAVTAEVQDHSDDLFGDMTAVDKATGERRGNAKGMWAAVRGLNTQLDEDDELIWLKAKQNALIGTAFFPTGSRTEYTRASLLTADLLFARVKQAILDHAAELGADFDPAKYTKLAADFATARGATRQGDAGTSTGRADAKDENRPALTQALTRAVKTVAQALPHDPARAGKYFPTELLLPGQPGDTEEDVVVEPAPVVPAP